MLKWTFKVLQKEYTVGFLKQELYKWNLLSLTCFCSSHLFFDIFNFWHVTAAHIYCKWYNKPHLGVVINQVEPDRTKHSYNLLVVVLITLITWTDWQSFNPYRNVWRRVSSSMESRKLLLKLSLFLLNLLLIWIEFVW